MITAYSKVSLTSDMLYELMYQVDRPIQIKSQGNNRFLIRFNSENSADRAILAFNEIRIFGEPLKLKSFIILQEKQVKIFFKSKVPDDFRALLANLSGVKNIQQECKKIVCTIFGLEAYSLTTTWLVSVKERFNISAWF
uniref:RRM domain-containing protein n=1 Tax=Spironucleus salmonicida TaxID=348837 RepID=V6LLA3_9EUKA|eukprot:EST45332.1 Hypothetical protein SS50377_14910 [Spironucleus salmonicida]